MEALISSQLFCGALDNTKAMHLFVFAAVPTNWNYLIVGINVAILLYTSYICRKPFKYSAISFLRFLLNSQTQGGTLSSCYLSYGQTTYVRYACLAFIWLATHIVT